MIALFTDQIKDMENGVLDAVLENSRDLTDRNEQHELAGNLNYYFQISKLAPNDPSFKEFGLLD